MKKVKYLICIIFIFISIVILGINKSYAINALNVPETNINITVNNITPGANIYMLIPDSLFKYNLEKYIENNTNNVYNIPADEAAKLNNFLDKSDYLGYIDYFKENGNEITYNTIELRHYNFSFGDNQVVGYYEYNDVNYIQIKIKLSDENTFKLILKDYLVNYDQTNILFLIDDFGVKQYITLENSDFSQNKDNNLLKECHIIIDYTTDEEAQSIRKYVKVSYTILYVFAGLLLLFLILKIRKEHKKAKKELEDRRNFFKSPERIERELEERKNKKNNKKIKKEKKKKK